jgi:hypothetical protein
MSITRRSICSCRNALRRSEAICLQDTLCVRLSSCRARHGTCSGRDSSCAANLYTRIRVRQICPSHRLHSDLQHGSEIAVTEISPNVLSGGRMIFGGTAPAANYVPQMLAGTVGRCGKMQVQAHALHTAACRFSHSHDVNRTHVVNKPFGEPKGFGVLSVPIRLTRLRNVRRSEGATLCLSNSDLRAWFVAYPDTTWSLCGRTGG